MAIPDPNDVSRIYSPLPTGQDGNATTLDQAIVDGNGGSSVLNNGYVSQVTSNPASTEEGTDIANEGFVPLQQQDPITSQDTASNWVDPNYHTRNPITGGPNDTPDFQGQLLRGYVYNAPEVAIRTAYEAQDPSAIFVPRVTTIMNPNDPVLNNNKPPMRAPGQKRAG